MEKSQIWYSVAAAQFSFELVCPQPSVGRNSAKDVGQVCHVFKDKALLTLSDASIPVYLPCPTEKSSTLMQERK